MLHTCTTYYDYLDLQMNTYYIHMVIYKRKLSKSGQIFLIGINGVVEETLV